MKFVRSAMLSACVLTLASCGGGGSGGSQASGASITGVAATGAPISGGTVTLKDAAGATKTAATDSNGSYSIDVTGLTAPFLFEADGIVGGNKVVLYSVAESAPAAGAAAVANITPLTDSIVANIAGASPAAFFNAPDSSKVTAASIQTAQTSLKTALASLMTAAGVPSDVDLLKTQFNADKTGLDAVLESLKVSVTVQGGVPVVQLVNKYNPSQVVTLSGSGAATQTGTITQATLPDLKTMDDIAAKYQAAVATSSALTTLLPALFDANYLKSGMNKAAEVSEWQSETDIIGATFGLPVIQSCNTAGDTCQVKMTLTYKSGTIEAYSDTVKKQGDGSWILYGNQYPHEFSATAVAQRNIRIDSVSAPAAQTGMQFQINPDVGGIGSAIVYAQSSSGGTDTEILKLSKKSATCGANINYLSFDIATDPNNANNCSNFHPMLDSEIDQLIAANGASQQFKIRLFTDEAYTTAAGGEGSGTYSNLYLDALPLKSAQLGSAPFAAMTSAGLANLAEFGPSGPLTLSWTASRAVPVEGIKVTLAFNGNARSIDKDSLVSLPHVTLSGNEIAGTPPATAYRSAYLVAADVHGRKYWTKYFGCGGGTCF